jgi:ribosomal protein S12 methylthiotransferase accessory factor
VLHATFAELGPERAVDPARLGLPEPEYYDHPAFRFDPYTPDARTTWIHGWSMAGNRALAIPEHAANWGLPGRHLLPESSSGCGLGNSLEEAVLYGLFEVAERDAFLMAGYARTP